MIINLEKFQDVEPLHLLNQQTGTEKLIENYENSCGEARLVSLGAKILEKGINSDDITWLGIAGAVILGGFNGYVIDFMKKGFIDAICSTGAQVYHDLHFAYGLPVKQISHPLIQAPDDKELRKNEITRIYDLAIGNKTTLVTQDGIIRDFNKQLNLKQPFSNATYINELGKYVLKTAPYPEKSFVAQAAELNVPIFLDSNFNHSLGMEFPRSLRETKRDLSPDINETLYEAASILYGNKDKGVTSFFWGGGGPRNFIQTLAPFLSEVFFLKYEGADRGVQITTALTRDGGLSGSTGSEAETWNKYKDAKKGFVQIHGDVTIIAPLIMQYLYEKCPERKPKELFTKLPELSKKLKSEPLRERSEYKYRHYKK